MFFDATLPILLLNFFLLSIVSDPSSATINIGTSDETIKRICKQALDYHFCRITLLSWDGIEYADMNELGNVAILQDQTSTLADTFSPMVHIQICRINSRTVSLIIM